LPQFSRYDAYGENIGGTDDVDNKYLFAGEQYDQNLGDYYLRARYYNINAGRFTRRDTYEGTLQTPITLHKYIYGNSNPATYVDPTGEIAGNNARYGDIVHETVGLHFFGEDPENRRYDPRPSQNPGGGFTRPTILQVIRQSLEDTFDTGVRGMNGKVPDLVDFKLHEIYEIKPNDARNIQRGENALIAELAALNLKEPGTWLPGVSYTTYPRYIPLGGDDIAEVSTYGPGLIVYDLVNNNDDQATATSAVYSIAFITAILIATELARQTAGAYALTRGFA